ncbi:MAG: hypothetical protein H0X47_14050 [Nitrospirales bacterium]|nr:hypothetical protein [Nitrospirales bacterium]
MLDKDSGIVAPHGRYFEQTSVDPDSNGENSWSLSTMVGQARQTPSEQANRYWLQSIGPDEPTPFQHHDWCIEIL